MPAGSHVQFITITIYAARALVITLLSIWLSDHHCRHQSNTAPAEAKIETFSSNVDESSAFRSTSPICITTIWDTSSRDEKFNLVERQLQFNVNVISRWRSKIPCMPLIAIGRSNKFIRFNFESNLNSNFWTKLAPIARTGLEPNSADLQSFGPN